MSEPARATCKSGMAAVAVQVVLPPMVPPSLGFFRPDGAYLINNGQALVVWLGRDLPAAWLSQVRSRSSGGWGGEEHQTARHGVK